MSRVILDIQIGTDGPLHRLRGREAATASQLVSAGVRGITAFNNPGPRLSHYVMKLRRRGIVIETIDEPHGGAFPGVHGRYVLRTVLCVVGKEAA